MVFLNISILPVAAFSGILRISFLKKYNSISIFDLKYDKKPWFLWLKNKVNFPFLFVQVHSKKWTKFNPSELFCSVWSLHLLDISFYYYTVGSRDCPGNSEIHTNGLCPENSSSKSMWKQNVDDLPHFEKNIRVEDFDSKSVVIIGGNFVEK